MFRSLSLVGRPVLAPLDSKSWVFPYQRLIVDTVEGATFSLSATSLFDIFSPFKATIAPFFAAVVSHDEEEGVYAI
jgi:hypothetical protein